MSNDQALIRALFEKYTKGTATPEETRQLFRLISDKQYDEEMKSLLLKELEETNLQDNYDTERWNKVLNKIKTETELREFEETPARRLGFKRLAVAASILLAIGVGSYFILLKKETAQLARNDVAPFSKQAILKTGHGKTLQLDSNRKGLLAQYANTNINAANDAVTYTNNNPTETAAVFDTLEIPAGGKPYHLKLADGSAITVNVASAIRFPENFRTGNNEVELIAGEAFFSIIHNVNAMLTIKAKDQTIRDYGTEFNVNTYNDEPDSRTTLVEGSIKVNHKQLIPGQQAIITASTLTIVKANIQQVTAWKDGYFRFNGEHIQAVMRELARCYNIEVVYDGKPTEVGFYLRISRSRNISEVLKGLERITKTVHFKIEGRRVIVLGKK